MFIVQVGFWYCRIKERSFQEKRELVSLWNWDKKKIETIYHSLKDPRKTPELILRNKRRPCFCEFCIRYFLLILVYFCFLLIFYQCSYIRYVTTKIIGSSLPKYFENNMKKKQLCSSIVFQGIVSKQILFLSVTFSWYKTKMQESAYCHRYK